MCISSCSHPSCTFYTAPGAPVRNFTVEVISATSVELSWLPPDPQLWNGVITDYTVVYKQLGPVGMTPADTVTSIIKTFPTQGNPLVNNPNSRHATVPLQNETVVLDHLQEYFVYEFSVFMENAAGRSEMSVAIIQELPGAGRFHSNSEGMQLLLSSVHILSLYCAYSSYNATVVILSDDVLRG